MPRLSVSPLIPVISLMFVFGACSDGTSPLEQVGISVEPREVILRTGEAQQFTATVEGLSGVTVTWEATGGTITSSGLYTAGQEPGVYAVSAASPGAPQYTANAAVTVEARAEATPVWNRSHADAAAYTVQNRVEADSADFSGFSADISATDGGQDGAADQLTVFVTDPVSGRLISVQSTGGSEVTTRRPGEGNGYGEARVRLMFEIRHEPMDVAFSASCSLTADVDGSSTFYVTLERLSSPNQGQRPINVDITAEEQAACSDIRSSHTLPPGLYELQGSLTSSAVVWDEEGTALASGRYTLQLDFE